MPGFTGITGQEEIMFADNCSFDGTQRGGAMTTNGELFIGATVSPHIKKGVLTSPDSSITIGYSSPNITLQANPSSIAYYSLTPYIVGSDIHSQYSTVQAAINAAVADGASAATPKNIYIKPGIYTENIKIYDGIYLIGFGVTPGGKTIGGGPAYSAAIYGNVTFDTLTDITCQISHILLYNNGSGNLFTIGSTNSISLAISNCSASAQGSGSAFEVTNTGNSLITIGGSIFSGVVAAINYHPTAPSNGYIIRINNCYVAAPISLNDDSTSNVSFYAADSTFNSLIDISAGFVELVNCDSEAILSGNTFTISSGQRVITSGCTFRGAPGTLYSSTGTLDMVNCAFIDYSTANPVGYSVNKFPSSAGYNGSEVYQAQAQAHTTDDTVTTLFSVVVNELESITMSGTISASKSDHTDSCGGNFVITARRASGGNVTLVGVVIANVNSTSTATFTADVDTGTQTVRVRVTGIAATTYNWVSNINYQKVLTNA